MSEEKLCPLCGHAMVWVVCQSGCDNGYFSLYDRYPDSYEPGDVEKCDVCNGDGSYWDCPIDSRHKYYKRAVTA